MGSPRTMQDIIEKMLKRVDMQQANKEHGDVWRTGNCTMFAQGLATALGLMGVEYDFGTYMDGDYHCVGYVYVDGVALVKNGVIDWKAYADAVLDEAHSWGSRRFTITVAVDG